jgi:hypothetical protein
MPRLPWLGVVLALAACDLKPSPRKQPAAATAPAAAPAAPAPAATTTDPDDLTQACRQIGIQVANVMVASATDAVAKAQYEQARADTVRATAEACMRARWDAPIRQCFLSASTQSELAACSARAPGPATSKPTRGS